MRFSRLAILAFLACISSCIGNAATRYVSVSGPGGDGLSWAAASTNLVATVESASSGDSVWVAAGDYYGNLRIPPGVTVMGGFPATGQETVVRDWRRHPTRLGLATNGFPTVVFLSGSQPAVFGGFRLVGMRGPSVVVAATNAMPVIRDLDMIHPGYGSISWTTEARSAWYFKGCDLVVAECSFVNAAYMDRALIEAEDCVGSISQNRFVSNGTVNDVQTFLSGLILVNGGSPVVERNWFAGNTGARGGGVGVFGSASPMIRNNIFTDQHAPQDSLGANDRLQGGSALFSNTNAAPRFVHNTVVTRYGGAIRLLGTNGLVANNLFAHGDVGPHVLTLDNIQTNGWIGPAATYSTNPTSVAGIWGNIVLESPFVGEPTRGEVSLKANSAAIDGGTDLADSGDTDFFGNPRVRGSAPDLGAVESDGATPAATRTVIKVRPDGDDGNDGLSWINAKRTIGSALDEAVRSGGDVWVARGSYREPTLFLGYLVSLYGGFEGTETAVEARRPSLNPVVLDGGGTNLIMAQAGAAFSADSRQILQEISGLTYRNGRSAWAGALVGHGLRVRGNRFESNRVTTERRSGSSDSPVGGGAIFVGSRSAELIGNVFENNSVVITNFGSVSVAAQYGTGGAVLLYEDGALIRDNLFVSNKADAGSSGDAIAVLAGGYVTRIENNTFINNSNPSNTIPFFPNIRKASIYVLRDYVRRNSGSVHLRNNLFAFNSGTASRDVLATTNISASFNAVLRNDDDSLPAGESNLVVDEGFAGAGSFPRLSATSALRDAGDPSTETASRLDLDGHPRQIGPGVDIGAFEFDPQDVVPPVPLAFVRPDGDDLNDGRTWAAAKRTIQSAAASFDISGGEIWVRGGEYQGPIQLAEFVSLYGGFAGTEGRREDRDWAINPAVILPGPNTNALGSPLVEMKSRAGGGTISGFRFQNGLGFSVGGVLVRGGGLISENWFAGNRGTNFQAGSTSQPMAGALVVYGPGTLRIENNLFVSNSISPVSTGLPTSPILATDVRANVEFVNNTVYRNSMTLVRRLMFFGSTNHLVANNIFLGNSDPAAGTSVPMVSASSNLVSTGTIQGLQTGGLFVADPRLVDPASNNYMPSAASPARDSADMRYAPSGLRDLAGRPRGEGGRNDIGAFEYYPPPPADFGVDITSPSGSAALVAGQPRDVNFSLTDSGRVLLNAVLMVNGRAVATNNGNVRMVRWAIPQVGTNSLVIRAEASGFQPALSPPVDVAFSAPVGDDPPVIVSVATAPVASQLVAPIRFNLNAIATDGASGVPARWEWRYASGDLIRAGSNAVGPASVDVVHAGIYSYTLQVWDRVGQTATTNYIVSVSSPTRWMAELGARFRPRAINDAGLVCGRLFVEGEGDFPSFLDEGLTTQLSIGSRSTATVNALNRAGTAVGRFGIYPMQFRRTGIVRLTDGDGMAYGINSDEVVAGVLNVEGGIAVPTIWSNGVATSLPLGDACCGVARAINDAGWIVGHVTDTNGIVRAALWRSNSVELLPSDGAAGAAYAINHSGLIVGQANGLPALWRDGVLEYLPSGGGEGIAMTITPDGAVGGSVSSRPVLWLDGTLREVTEGMSGLSRARVAGGTVVSLNSGLDMVVANGEESVLIRQRANMHAPRLTVDPLLLPVTFRIGAGLGFAEASLIIEGSTDLRNWSPVATNALDFQIPVDDGFRFFRAVRSEP